MKSLNYLKFSIFAITFGIVGALAGAPQANASSPYDTVINYNTQLNAQKYGCGGSGYATTHVGTWSDINVQLGGHDRAPGEYDSFVLWTEYYSGGGSVSTIYAYDEGEAWLAFKDPGPYASLAIYGTAEMFTLIKNCVDYEESENRFFWSYNSPVTFPGYGQSIAENNAYSQRSINASDNISVTNIPEGYEGPSIPGLPLISSEYVPDLYVSESTDWIATLHDRNFNTFDTVAWTCSEDGNSILEDDSGLVPVLYWQVWRDDYPTEGSSLMLGDGFQSASAPVSIELPINREEAREYRVAAWYECGGSVDFSDASNFTFVVNKMGVLDETAALSNCISNEFPFIQLDDCISNLAIFGKIALFGGATFNNTWTASSDCTSMTTLNGWMGLGSTTLCPQIPGYVRNVVTPFVTFILGLITMRFLATRTGKDF